MNLQLDWKRSGEVYPEGHHPDIGENGKGVISLA